MEIFLAQHAGHCFGVKAAIKKAFEVAEKEQQAIYSLGPLIHNPQVVEKLEKEGVVAVKNLSEIEKGVIIIRSHGVSPDMIQAAKDRGLTVVDATCPFVKRAQNLAQELVDDGYRLIIVGEATHPEVEGIVGTVQGKAQVVSGPGEVMNVPLHTRYGIIAQTTQSLKNLQEVTCAMLTRTSTLKVVNTICNATTDLQEETRELARKVDIMIVVGGRNSANTTRLAMISQEASVPTYHVETAAEIQPHWFTAINRVGVTAGTSTPDWIITEVMEQVRSIDRNHQHPTGI